MPEFAEQYVSDEDDRHLADDEQAYRFMHEHIALVRFKSSVLRIKGRDALDFLNRMSTNELLSMEEGRHETTIFTTEKGRVIDCVNVVRLHNEIILVGGENEKGLRDWLQKFVIMEEIEVTDVSENSTVVGVMGNEKEWLLSKFLGYKPENLGGSDVLPSRKIPNLLLISPSIWNQHLHLIFLPDNSGWSHLAGIEKEHSGRVKLLTSDDKLFQTYRIENGVPLLGRELTGDVNPLEARLTQFISFTKGCYIGQEVIARLETYNKVQKRLHQFDLGAAGYGKECVGAILREGNEVGQVTSAAWSFKAHSEIALGYLDSSVTPNDLTLCIPGDTSLPVTLL